MVLAFALILWVVLSVVVHIYLGQNDRMPAPIMAGLMASGLGIVGLFQLQPLQVSHAGDTYHDTYFTLGHGFYLLTVAIGYLFASGVTRHQTPIVYADYPDAFQWLNLSSRAGAFLCFVGLTGMVMLTVVVLGQRFILGRTT